MVFHLCLSANSPEGERVVVMILGPAMIDNWTRHYEELGQTRLVLAVYPDGDHATEVTNWRIGWYVDHDHDPKMFSYTLTRLV